MGGGDLNMKKSWHPLLLKNQERVWLEEKKALEEKKKLEQLRKEKEEERQLQELQRLQEEQTGKKRTEKLEWMYTTPATGTNQNPNDLEDYLLGKKRVDKILTADENAKLGATHKSFIAVQNANTVRDIASKIREDPLLAIKQQEQAALQTLMSNPLRREAFLQRNGIKPKKDKKEKKEKEERKRLKQSRKSHRDSRSRSRSPHRRDHSQDINRRRGRSFSPPMSRPHSPGRYDSYSSRRSRSPTYRRRRDSRSPPRYHDRYHRSSAWPRSDESDNAEFDRTRNRGRSRSPQHEKRRRSPSYERYDDHRSKRSRPLTPPLRESREPTRAIEDRAAKLAAMTSNASSMSVERQERLKTLLEKEKADLEAEDRARAKSKGMGGFLSQEQKKVFGGTGGLEDRIRRGRGGLVAEAD